MPCHCLLGPIIFFIRTENCNPLGSRNSSTRLRPSIQPSSSERAIRNLSRLSILEIKYARTWASDNRHYCDKRQLIFILKRVQTHICTSLATSPSGGYLDGSRAVPEPSATADLDGQKDPSRLDTGKSRSTYRGAVYANGRPVPPGAT